MNGIENFSAEEMNKIAKLVWTWLQETTKKNAQLPTNI